MSNLAEQLKARADEFEKVAPEEAKNVMNAANEELPLPATYIIGQDGVVKYAFVKTDYKLRAEPADVVEELRKLAASG